MIAPDTKSRARQFSGFVLVGGIAATINWSSRIALSSAGAPLTLAVVVAFAFGLSTAYVLSRRFVFARSGRPMGEELARFTLVNLVALAQTWAVTIALARWFLPSWGWTWHPEAVGHAAGVACPVVSSYFGHRFFTFERAAIAADAAAVRSTKIDGQSDA